MRSSTRRCRSLLLAGLLALALAPGAVAEEHQVSQRTKVFDPREITVKAGDTVTFLNDDDVSHNVFSRSEGARFNLKFQRPGEDKSQVFETPGTAVVRCAIHPKMKLTVHVEADEPEAPGPEETANADDAPARGERP